MPYLRTHGMVLRCTDFSETSQVVAVLTPDEGQMHLLAKGSRRPRKDSRGALDVLTHCDLVIARKPAGQLHIAAEWTLRENFPGLLKDLGRLWIAFYADEVALALTAETPDDGPVCGQLLDALRRLDRTEDPDMTFFRFLTRALRTLGHAPLVSACAHCGGPPDGPTRFGPGLGGALCGRCGASESAAFSISRGALAIMARLAASPVAEYGALRATPAQAAEIRRAFNAQIQYHLGRALRSGRFLNLVT